MRKDLLKVLNMIKNEKVSIEKAANLIEEIYLAKGSVVKVENYKEKILRVLVKSVEGDNIKVNLPVGVIISMLKTGGKLPIKGEYFEGIDVKALSIYIILALESETIGEIITAASSKGDTVKVIVE